MLEPSSPGVQSSLVYDAGWHACSLHFLKTKEYKTLTSIILILHASQSRSMTCEYIKYLQVNCGQNLHFQVVLCPYFVILN